MSTCLQGWFVLLQAGICYTAQSEQLVSTRRQLQALRKKPLCLPKLMLDQALLGLSPQLYGKGVQSRLEVMLCSSATY